MSDSGTRTEQILSILGTRGALGVHVREVADRLSAPLRTVREDLASLERAELVERPTRGIYRLSAASESVPMLSPTGQQIWRALSERRLPAYLSGLDIIGGAAQQFLFIFPHLVISLPASVDDVDWALTGAGFAVRPLGTNTMLPNTDHVVLLGSAADWRNPIYQVRENLAPAELAWLDLLRAVETRAFPISGFHLGQILGNLRRDARYERLQVLARRQPARNLLPLLKAEGAPRSELLGEVAEGLTS